jgi:radical SAM superfamily enzyme YgiQ (UPF0313 family)
LPGRSRSRKAGVSAIVLFPNKRDVACASLGFLKAYEVLKSRVAVVDLSYVPSVPDDHIVSPRQGLLLGEMSHLEVRRFDIIGFSLSYENDFEQVPGLLIRAGLPPLAHDRSGTLPLVIGGGFTMSVNPLPIADFVDAVVVGEIEPAASAIVDMVEKAGAEGAPKARLLEMLAAIPGLYVPALGERPVTRIWSAVGAISPESEPATRSHFGEMFLVETGRGCGRGCHFCAAGNLYRPVRMRSGSDILALTGDAARVGLVGTAVGDHPDLPHILEEITGAGRSVGIASLRPDQIRPDIAALLVKGGIRTIAIAPEAGSESLRSKIGKPLGDAVISDAVEMLSAAGIRRVKLYFMIGLPGETDADVEAAVRLVAELAGVRGRSRLAVAAGPFVPKPQTVFQWAPFCDRRILRRRVAILRRIARIKGCSLKVQPIDEAWVEAVISRGDRALSAPLLEAACQRGSLKRILLRGARYDPTVELDTEKPLPWDFIDAGIDRKRLRLEYLRSQTV